MSVNLNDPVRLYLSSVAEARLEAQRLSYKRKRLEAQATRITANLTGLPSGGSADRESLLAKLADLRDESEAACLQAEKVEEEVAAFIGRIPDMVSRVILRLRYCECLEWVSVNPRRKTVIGEMAKVNLLYSIQQLYRLHGKALNQARELYYKEHEND